MKYFALSLVLLSQIAFAKEFLIGDPAWGARLSFPEKWENDNYMGTWYQGRTADRKVWLSALTFQALPKDWHSNWLPKHLDTFGVEAEVPDAPPAPIKCKVGKFQAMEYHIPAKWDGDPVEISVFAVELAPKQIFLITIGGTQRDRALHKATIDNVLASLRLEQKEPDKAPRRDQPAQQAVPGQSGPRPDSK